MMTFICPECQSLLELLPFKIVRCQCGALYGWATTMTTSTAPSTIATGNCVIGVQPKRDVPKAFYDAFNDEELVP